MKNRYIKHTHISENKFLRVLRLFCADLTSTQTAEMMKIKKLAPSDSTIYGDDRKAYDGLVNAGYKKHYRVTHSEDVFAKWQGSR